MAVIEVRHLVKIFGDASSEAVARLEEGDGKTAIREATGSIVAVNDVSFEVQAGEIFVVMGLSGSGKSTLLRCLNRLVEPTRGTVRVDGENVLDASDERLLALRRRTMSMVFQNFGLFPHRTVLGNVEYGLEVSGMDTDARREKAAWALSLVGLDGYEDRRTTELSGGMQQRVGLARALANDPEILLMDEAFSALDPLIRTEMQNELLELQAELNRTIVFITHDLDEALKLGDRIAIMREGAIVQIGTPEEILMEPADDYVRAFVQNVDRTKALSAQTIMQEVPTVALDAEDVPGDPTSWPEPVREAIQAAVRDGHSVLYVVDRDGRPLGVWRPDGDPAESGTALPAPIHTEVPSTQPDTSIARVLPRLLEDDGPLAVVDAGGRLVGMIAREAALREVARNAG